MITKPGTRPALAVWRMRQRKDTQQNQQPSFRLEVPNDCGLNQQGPPTRSDKQVLAADDLQQLKVGGEKLEHIRKWKPKPSFLTLELRLQAERQLIEQTPVVTNVSDFDVIVMQAEQGAEGHLYFTLHKSFGTGMTRSLETGWPGY